MKDLSSTGKILLLGLLERLSKSFAVLLSQTSEKLKLVDELFGPKSSVPEDHALLGVVGELKPNQIITNLTKMNMNNPNATITN